MKNKLLLLLTIYYFPLILVSGISHAGCVNPGEVCWDGSILGSKITKFNQNYCLYLTKE